MANRKGLPIGSWQTGRQEPKTQRREPETQRCKPDYERWMGTRERVGHRVMGPERRAGPKANWFHKIKGWKCHSFSHTCAKPFLCNREATEYRANIMLSEGSKPSESVFPCEGFCINHSR